MNDHHWLEIPAAILQLEGSIWVREPADASLMDIWQAFRDSSYAKPFIHDDGEVRSLYFNFDSTQSEMRLDDEYALSFAYTRTMMAFLLFNPQPRHLVIVGLGGGSMTKFCCRQLPQTRLTTLEIDADVIGMASMFKVPAASDNNRILHADAAEYFRTNAEDIDVVLIDGCDADGTAAIFYEADFYESLKRTLTPGGIVMVNLVGGDARAKALKATLEQCFCGPAAEIHLEDEKNRVLVVLNKPEQATDWRKIKPLAKDLAQKHGLEFPEFARKLQGAWPN